MPVDPEPPLRRPTGETLAERVRRDGPLCAEEVWTLARRLLEILESLHVKGAAHGSLDPSKILFPHPPETSPPFRLLDAAAFADDPGALREDLRRLGATLWFALTGEAPGPDWSWQRLDAAGITPELGALPVLLARTLTGDPAQRPATALALVETLNVLASLGSTVPVCADMPNRVPGPDPVAPIPDPRPPAPTDSELWTRTPAQLAAPNRRRQDSAQVWNTLVLLAAGSLGGFFGGIVFEKSHEPPTASVVGSVPAAPSPAALLTATPAPASTPVILAPARPVGAVGVVARLERIQTLQPDVRDVLKYARELRRVATLPVTDPAFPSDTELAALLARFDWTDPASPDFRRTPLVLVLGYDDAGDEPSQAIADAMTRGLSRAKKIKSPIYTCGLGNADKLPEVQTAGVTSGQFVEVWVAFTLF